MLAFARCMVAGKESVNPDKIIPTSIVVKPVAFDYLFIRSVFTSQSSCSSQRNCVQRVQCWEDEAVHVPSGMEKYDIFPFILSGWYITLLSTSWS